MSGEQQAATRSDWSWLTSFFLAAAVGFVLAADVEDVFWNARLPEGSVWLLVVIPICAGLALKLHGILIFLVGIPLCLAVLAAVDALVRMSGERIVRWIRA